MRHLSASSRGGGNPGCGEEQESHPQHGGSDQNQPQQQDWGNGFPLPPFLSSAE